jgi:hypothetical protein
MAFVSGNGGKLTVGATDLHVGQWQGNFGARLVENTHSGTSGTTNYEKVVLDPSWSADVPWDDANIPDVDAGLVPGDKVTVKFFMGGGAKFYQLANTTVESAEATCDNAGNIVRYRVSGKGGTITRPLT